MDETTALERCMLVWTWMSENIGKTKKQAYKALGLDEDRNFCPLCCYVLSETTGNSLYRQVCNARCPLSGRWGPDKYEPCWYYENYYGEWLANSRKHMNSIFFKWYYAKGMKRNALNIVKSCGERLKELEGG